MISLLARDANVGVAKLTLDHHERNALRCERLVRIDVSVRLRRLGVNLDRGCDFRSDRSLVASLRAPALGTVSRAVRSKTLGDT